LDSFLNYAEGASIARCMLSSTVDVARWAETQYLTMPNLIAIVITKTGSTPLLHALELLMLKTFYQVGHKEIKWDPFMPNMNGGTPNIANIV
jgi:hypothetical protein